MLLVKMVRIGGPDHAANYRAEVFLNRTRIWHCEVGPHNRPDGWERLVALLSVDAYYERKAFHPPNDGAKSTQETRCPACGVAYRKTQLEEDLERQDQINYLIALRELHNVVFGDDSNPKDAAALLRDAAAKDV